jgi:hypothetical protein
MALAEVVDFSSWIKKDLDATVQEELVACIAAAQAWIAREAGLRSLEKESAAKTEYLDGALLPNNEDAWLPMSVRPVWHTGTSDAMTVTENGTSLTVATAFSSGAGVVVAGANSLDRVRIYREGGWSNSGRQNIAVSCKVGFDASTTASTNPLPYDVKRLVMGVAWKLFNQPAVAGRSSVGKAGQTVSLVDDLSLMERATLDRLRGV